MRNKNIRRIRHAARPEVSGPVHVTLRILAGLPNMRKPRTYRVIERAFRAGCEGEGFRVVHYSVLSNHMHLFVNAANKESLSKGMQALAIRIARALNNHWNRKGRLFFDRYHSRVIEPVIHKIKRVLKYVLQNARKHGVSVPRGQADPYSSARWARWDQGWLMKRPLRSPPVAEPLCANTWIALSHGFDLEDLPGQRLHFDPIW